MDIRQGERMARDRSKDWVAVVIFSNRRLSSDHFAIILTGTVLVLTSIILLICGENINCYASAVLFTMN